MWHMHVQSCTTGSVCDSYMASSSSSSSSLIAKSLVWDCSGLEKGMNGKPTDLDTAICPKGIKLTPDKVNMLTYLSKTLD